jgi:hypothetical protein
LQQAYSLHALQELRCDPLNLGDQLGSVDQIFLGEAGLDPEHLVG